MDVKASSGTPSAASKTGDSSNASQEAGATSPGTSPIGSPSEVRFAVVMYGGVSLAIYINGIAQELLRMVQATATGGEGQDPNRPLIDEGKLKSSDRVYRKLSYLRAGEKYEDLERRLENNAPISTRFIVDLISGASAGGINGIFLAKALANGQDMKELQALWIKEGDVGVPRSIPNLVFFHFLKLLYLFEVALIVGSTLLLNATIQRFSLTAFAITLATHLTVLILGDQMQYKNKWFWMVKAAGVALFVSLVILGLVSFLAITGIAGSWWEAFTKVNEWFKALPPNGWISRWPVRIAIVSIFLAFLLWVVRKDRPLPNSVQHPQGFPHLFGRRRERIGRIKPLRRSAPKRKV